MAEEKINKNEQEMNEALKEIEANIKKEQLEKLEKERKNTLTREEKSHWHKELEEEKFEKKREGMLNNLVEREIPKVSKKEKKEILEGAIQRQAKTNFLTTDELASRLGVSEIEVLNWIETGKIRVEKDSNTGDILVPIEEIKKLTR